jgi:[ribosomal protein S18]-alanine N-acetyltransferase
MSALATIGLARADEADQIAQMSRDLIEHGLKWSWTQYRVQRHIQDRDTSVIVARNEGRVIAFAIMHFGEEKAHLNLLAVAREWRRQDYGRRLIDWLVRSAQVAGILRIDLELRAHNSQARAFYENLGFTVTGLKPKYYEGIEPALTMSRTL